ncbi:MAG: hypothetical protein ACREIM_01925 [Nitrospiraceae bacterium]
MVQSSPKNLEQTMEQAMCHVVVPSGQAECFLTNRFYREGLSGLVSERVLVQGRKDDAWKTLRSMRTISQDGGLMDIDGSTYFN